MTNQCCGVGGLSSIAMGLSGATPTRMDFVTFHSVEMIKTLSDGATKAIRGSLDHRDTSAAEGMLFVKFRVKLWVTQAKLAIILPMLGFTNVSTAWTQKDSMPDCKVLLGPAGTKEHIFDKCVPTDWILGGAKGVDPVWIDIGFMGTTWTTQAAAAFFVSTTSPAMTEGYVYPFGQGANNVSSLNMLGQTVYFPQFRLHMNYHTIREFNNSVTATNLCPTDHDLVFSTSALYSSCDGNEPLLDTPLGGDVSGAALTLNFTRTQGGSTYTSTFVVANAKLMPRAPNIVKNDFNRLAIQARCFATSSTALLVVTNSVA